MFKNKKKLLIVIIISIVIILTLIIVLSKNSIIKTKKNKIFDIDTIRTESLKYYTDDELKILDFIDVTFLFGFNKMIVNKNELYVESGCMINKVATSLASNGYAGLDFACGIPGTIGGCIYGNAGCYGSSISDILISVIVFDGRKTIELTNEQLKFKYRYSMLKENINYIVLSAKFKIHKEDINELKNRIVERTKKRIQTQDLTHPSNGSVFRNPENQIAGKLIDEAGLKGLRVNDAVVSNKHANFIINDGNATSEDIISLIKKVKKEVKKVYNIDLELEQEIIK